MKVEIKHTRTGLHEGRIKGLGYGFLRRIDTEHFETASPISTCKDYLNDVVYVEVNNIPNIGTIYGFNYQKCGLFDNSDMAYLGGKIYNYAEYKTIWDKNLENIQRLVNYIEQSILNLSQTTSIYPSEDDVTIIELPKFWIQNPWSISFISFLIRAGFNYDGIEDIHSYLQTTRRKNVLESGDTMYLVQCYKAIDLLIDNHDLFKSYPYNDKTFIREGKFIGYNSTIHNYGMAYMVGLMSKWH